MLSRPDIEKALKSKKLLFFPETDLSSRIKQVSIDMPIGRNFTEFLPPPGYIHSVKITEDIWNAPGIWRQLEQSEYLLEPRKFVLAQTQERVKLPNNLSGLIEGRSSFARLGISVHITAPKIDPGFNGTITLEMYNHGELSIVLRAGIDAPAQLILFKVSSPLKDEHLYGADAGDVFQYQTTPTPSGPPRPRPAAVAAAPDPRRAAVAAGRPRRRN